MTGGPLDGLRVVDRSTDLAGTRATGLLAAYGADVVWIEPPGGSPLRLRSPEAASVFNRNKRSVVLDLSDDDQRHDLSRLIMRADVFVESGSHDAAERAGGGFASMHSLNHRLVYCSISGFGRDGPHRGIAGRDALVHALVGTMAEQAGHREGPIFTGLPQASLGASYLAVIGVLAALYRRSHDGVGRRVETSLLDGALAYHSMLWSESDASVAAMAAKGGGPNSTAGTRLVTRSFVCADAQYIGIHTGAVGGFGRLMAVLGLDDRIPPSPSGLDMGAPLTADQMDLLETELHRLIAAQPRAHWVETLRQAEVCAIEHLAPCEVFDQPQAQHNEMVVEVDDAVLGRVQQVGTPAKFPSLPSVHLTPAPIPGQHTDEVLARARADGPAPKAPSPSRAAEDPMGDVGGAPAYPPLLEGVRVLDIGAYFAGPYSSRLLADLGADVIKLEPTQGDQLRGIDQCFFPAQAGKRSIAMNLKDLAVWPSVERLLEWADVVHHNLRPGAAERLGLSYDDLHSTHPDLIYLYAPGWGSGGPDRLRQSFAPMMSGYVGVTFEAAGCFNEPLPSTCNEDPGNGMLGAACILMGLLHRRESERGLYIENPQLNATMAHVAHIVRTIDGDVLGAGRLDPMQYGFGPFERLYETADGWICLAALEGDEVRGLEKVLGFEFEPGSIVDRDDRDDGINRDDGVNRDDSVADRIAGAFATRSTSFLLRELQLAGVPAVEPVGRNSGAFLRDPENRRTGRVAECLHPTKGYVREIAQLLRVSSASVPPHRLAPDLGAQTEPILESLGLRADEVVALREGGAIR
jgi:crotonobetainyl-CoA:carnitine CoA-transferase CaiB-like acyl-CoA transferase